MFSTLRKKQKISRDLINCKVPPEILHKIFQKLQLCDMKMAVLVCRQWRDVGETQPLWRGAMVTATKKNLLVVPNLIYSKRIQAVDTLGMKTTNEALLSALSGHPSIRKLKIYADTDLTAIDPHLFADTIFSL